MQTATDRFTRLWDNPPGIAGRLSVVNHKPVGLRFIVTAMVFFVIGGVMALLIRLQLVVPHNELIGPQAYNELFTMHGTTMMFLFAIPFMEGLAGYLLPLMFGARDLPYPRLNAFAYWCYLFGGTLLYSSFLFGLVPDGGWFFYPPLTGPEFSPGLSQDFWLLGITLVEFSAIAAAIEIIVLVLKMRPPGMSLNQMPLFAWSMLVTSFMILFAFTPLLSGTIMLELDRKIGTGFFQPEGGGDELLWQHIFWFFGHPEVYIMFLPGAGIISMIIPVFARRPISGYAYVATATVATGIISFGLWVHHMFATGIPALTLIFFGIASFVIAIPSGVQIFAFLTTLATGRLVWRTPLLYAIGFIVIFVAGGITGVMLAAVPFNLQVHDGYFVVAHFHYVLVGGVVFPMLAAVYFWFPKITGRMLSERMGAVSFWLTFIGFNVAFFPQHIVGLLGMPRRVYTYHPDLGWERDNLLSTIGAMVLAIGLFITLFNLLKSKRWGVPAGANPWDADQLEWSIPSPPPPYNFRTIPSVTSRNPIWDEADPGQLTARTEHEPAGLTSRPVEWRGSLGTSVLDAEAEQVVHLPAPTLWPLVAAAGLLVFFVGVLIDVYLLMPVGGLIFLTAAAGWIKEDEKQYLSEDANIFGLPVLTVGPASVAWWGMIFAITVAATAVATFVSAYLFLRAGAAAWPPAGMPLPGLVWPMIATALLTVSGLPMLGLLRAGGNVRRVKAALSVATVLGLGFAAVVVGETLQRPYLPDEHVYAGLVYTLTGAGIAAVLVGVALNVAALARAWLAPLPRRLHVLTDNAVMWWCFSILAWGVIMATAYLFPRVT